MLLLGNAAHSLHPVAGQGFNLALRGVAACLEMIKRKPEDFDGLAQLKQLQDSLSIDQTKTITFSDQVVKLFGHQSLLVSLGRDIGLIALENLPVLKSAFASQAMGLAGKKAKF